MVKVCLIVLGVMGVVILLDASLEDNKRRSQTDGFLKFEKSFVPARPLDGRNNGDGDEFG